MAPGDLSRVTDDIGAWLAERRAAARLSQAELARALGKRRSWVSSLETGGFRPRVEDLAVIGLYFKVPLSLLMEKAGYTNPEIDAVVRPLPEAPARRYGGWPLADPEPRYTEAELQRFVDAVADEAVRRTMDELGRLLAGQPRDVPRITRITRAMREIMESKTPIASGEDLARRAVALADAEEDAIVDPSEWERVRRAADAVWPQDRSTAAGAASQPDQPRSDPEGGSDLPAADGDASRPRQRPARTPR